MLDAILIANRGEIAVRIIRACRDLNIRSVAVYSDADEDALHVRMADAAYRIGPGPAVESYLVPGRILDAARRSGATAIHPGYGFLSENAAFAAAVEAAGLTFIGPSPDSIALMGSKIAARKAIQAHGVPMIPGTIDPLTSDEEARSVASRIGYPVMLKASAGGGGKGLRHVRSAGELASALAMTRSEAQSAFGDDAVYVEKYLDCPRHIEIQVVADRHGNAVHLGERECSIQRRHQKVIEECPSPIVDADLRRRMGDAALRVVEAARYHSTGTVEFLVDADRNFYFLEMNTRLQVEHPVTEMVTGVDLVVEQIRVAAGERLSIRQADIQMRGVAIECRVYAEDPDNDFLPSPGRIESLRIPSGPGIRDDGGVYAGWTVPLEYDPLLSKLVAWGPDRAAAIARMCRALGEYRIRGVRNNLAFFREVLRDPDFETGTFDTGYIDRWLRSRAASDPSPVPETDRDLAMIAAAFYRERTRPALASSGPEVSVWKRHGREQQVRGRR